MTRAPTPKSTPTPSTETDCEDREDNDLDDLVNCVDDDCTDENDCYDGVDDDADGLLDCEDDDCVDICIEDCRDDFDNDLDGRIDCADDECFDVGDCGGPYRMVAELQLDTLAWGAGSDWSDKGSNYSDNIAVYPREGQVRVTGVADGWSGPAINCEGALQGGLERHFLSCYENMFTYIGPYTGVDYALGFQPTTLNSTLSWAGACPLDALQDVTLGFVRGADYVYLNNAGAWVKQYTGKSHEHSGGSYYGHDRTIDFLYSVTQVQPVCWRGTY